MPPPCHSVVTMQCRCHNVCRCTVGLHLEAQTPLPQAAVRTRNRAVDLLPDAAAESPTHELPAHSCQHRAVEYPTQSSTQHVFKCILGKLPSSARCARDPWRDSVRPVKTPPVQQLNECLPSCAGCYLFIGAGVEHAFPWQRRHLALSLFEAAASIAELCEAPLHLPVKPAGGGAGYDVARRLLGGVHGSNGSINFAERRRQLSLHLTALMQVWPHRRSARFVAGAQGSQIKVRIGLTSFLTFTTKAKARNTQQGGHLNLR